MSEKCDAVILLGENERELRCVLPLGHDGPVHEDENGEAWGDLALPASHHIAPA